MHSPKTLDISLDLRGRRQEAGWPSQASCQRYHCGSLARLKADALAPRSTWRGRLAFYDSARHNHKLESFKALTLSPTLTSVRQHS